METENVAFDPKQPVIGSIGASGAPGAKLDDACARAGLDKIRDRLK